MWVAAFIIGGLTLLLILWPAVAHRRKRMGEVPVQTRYNVPLEVLYTFVPVVIILVIFGYTARDQAELVKLTDDPREHGQRRRVPLELDVQLPRRPGVRHRHAGRGAHPVAPGQRDDPLRAHLARRHPLVLGARLPVQDGRRSRAAPTSSS